MDASLFYQTLCSPAKVYVILFGATLAFQVITGRAKSILNLLIAVIMGLIWALFLSFLCDRGFSMVSWFIALLPIIVIALRMTGNKKLANSLKMK